MPIRRKSQRLRQALRAWEDVMTTKQDTIQRQRGILGNGSGVVRVEDRPDLVYMRLNADSTRVWEVISDPNKIPDVDGLPVIVEKQPDSRFWEVIDIDREALVRGGIGLSGLKAGTHGEDHEWPDHNPGFDVVNIHRRAVVDLRTEAQYPTYNMSVNVRPIVYTYQGATQRFFGDTIDLTTYVPGSGIRSVLTYLDVRTNRVWANPGVPVAYNVNASPSPPVVPWYAKPSALITLRQNQNIVTESDIEGFEKVIDDEGLHHNLTASRAPTSGDDASYGWSEGSMWIYGTSIYICTNPALGAAVWTEPGGSSGGGAWPAADKVNISTTEYATWALAEAAFVGGEQAIVGEGSYTSDAPTISTSTDILGSGVDVSILTTSASDEVLIISNSSQPILASLTLSNTKPTSNPKALQVTSGGVNAYGVKFEATGATAGTNYGTFLSGAGNNHWFWNCIWDTQGAATNNYAIYVNDGDYVNCWAPDVRNGDIYVSQGTLILRNPAIVGNITATGAAVTVYVIGGVVGGNITQASGATVNLYNAPFITGTLTGTINGFYTNAAGNMRSTYDLFAYGDNLGLNRRLIWPVASTTDHFRTGSITTGYAWLAAGTVDGSTPAAPTVVDYSYLGDMLYAYSTTNVMFMYKSRTANPIGKSILGAFIASNSCQQGMRIDKNNDTDFAEMWIQHSSGPSVIINCAYNIGGSKTTVTGTVPYPATLPIYLQIYMYDNGATAQWIFYVVNATGGGVIVTSSGGFTYWGSTTTRSGLLDKQVGATITSDVFYDQFGV